MAVRTAAIALLLLPAARAPPSPAVGGPPLLHITWSRLPDRPVGTQDSLFGALDGQFVVALGNRGNNGTGPQHGMWNGGYALPLADPSRGWAALPPSPSTTEEPCGGHLPCHRGVRNGVSVSGTARVELPPSLGGGEGLVTAGGFSHTECSNQSYLLRRNATAGEFAYSPLPPLPWDLGTGALTAIGSRVFVVGGADCGSPPNTERYITWSDRHGRNRGIGKRVLILDLAQLEEGWQRGPDLPGTPRESHALLAVNQTIYVLGGEASENATVYQPELLPPKHACPNISRCRSDTIDNWKLDVQTMKWSRLPNNPHLSVGPMGSAVVWRDRWTPMRVLCADPA